MAPKQAKNKNVASSSVNDRELFDGDALKRYNDYSGNIITKVVTAESNFDDTNIKISECLQYQGIHKFLGLATTAYPTFLRQMLANLRRITDCDGNAIEGVLMTKVNGVDISITIDDIVKDFKLKTHSRSITIKTANDIPDTVDWSDLRAAISPNPVEHPKGGLYATSLHLQCRILHKIIAQCILGKSSGFDQVSALEEYLIFIINGKKEAINWAELIFYKLEYGALRRAKSSIPYAFALSEMMKRKGVDISKAPSQVYNHQFDLLGEKMMRNMGFEKIRGEWMPMRNKRVGEGSSREVPPPPQEEVEEEHDGAFPSYPPRVSKPTSIDTYNLLYANTERQAYIDRRQRELEDHQRRIEEKVDILGTNMCHMTLQNDYAIRNMYNINNWTYPVMPNFEAEVQNMRSQYLFSSRPSDQGGDHNMDDGGHDE